MLSVLRSIFSPNRHASTKSQPPGRIPMGLASRAATALACMLLLASAGTASAQISFTSSGLSGETLNNPTSLDWGPDDRLYVTEQSGSIYAYTIQRNGATDYQVIATETINLVKNIPNHDDDGSVSGQTNRQVTGILAAGTATNPILYVTSSDPRIGAGGGGNDSNLDTNSGIVSRLTWNDSSWDHVQIVRGLPRSEENHSTNGMQLDTVNNVLYLMQGGHDNKGAPSNNFAATPEYALSAAMLSVDLDVIDALPVQVDGAGQSYAYDIPTLDDPTRANSTGDIDVSDPFGGNDGRNQARIVPGGPVQIYSPGYRNAYDVVLTQAGRLYTFDNGPNTGWGGIPVGEGTTACTNELSEATSTGYGDGLHFVSGPGYYGGHPHPTRANPENSDLVIYENQGGSWVEVDRYDWQVDFAAAPPVPFGTGDPQQCDYRIPGVEDGALAVINASTNGMDEYTASNFGGAMQGDLLAASFNGNIYRMQLNAAGDDVVNGANGEVLLSGFGATPLDVVALDDNQPFPGVIIAVTYGADNITVFEPVDFLQCTGADDDQLDEDADGYDNADEIDNGTNPCSGGSKPDDADGDFTSDLNDPDDDNDTLPDTSDPFAIDPTQGIGNTLPISYPLFNGDPGTGFFGLGFTGLMTNGTSDYLSLFDPNGLIAGGAAGLFTVEAVPAGDAYQATNTQQNGFQFGADVDDTTGVFTVQFRVNSPYFEVGGVPSAPINFQAFGGFIGDGTQDDYLKIVIAAASGAGGVQVLLETGGTPSATLYGTGVVGDILGSIYVDLYLTVDPLAATVQPAVALDGGTLVPLGSPIAVPAAWFSSADSQALAVGIISTSNASSTPFGATWDFIEVYGACTVDADCNDGNTCTTNTCDAGVCLSVPEPAGTACEADASLCTVDSCDGAGVCANDSTVSCPAGEACTPGTGVCEVIPTDVDNDGMIFDDPCPVDPRNLCFGDVAVDETTLSPIRINSGSTGACSGTRIDCNGDTWAADFGWTSNADSNSVCNLAGGCPISGIDTLFGCTDANTEDLFQCERWDQPAAPELQYDFDLPDGTYLVNLYFANGYDGTTAVGSRVFDVSIEGVLVLDDFDQVAAAQGSGIAVVRSALVTVSDGDGLQIDFGHGIENPAIKGIEVLVGNACLDDTHCDDGNACTVDTCNAGACEYTNALDGTSCDDGVSCTSTDVCTSGVCGGSDNCVGGEICSPVDDVCIAPTHDAYLEVTLSGGIESSTYNAGAFALYNDSPNGQKITSFSIDLSTTILRDIVFDPTDGTPAGDSVSKCLVTDSGEVATGYVVPTDPCVTPYSGPNELGFYTITMDFTDFDPGESFSFSTDIDPTSIQGGSSSGAAGSVSGLEISGATLSVTFDGGVSYTTQLFAGPASEGGGKNNIRASVPVQPGIEVLGVPSTPMAVTAASQTVRVSGPVGADVRLLHAEGVMELMAAAGFDVEPFEANTLVTVNQFTGTIGGTGYVDFPVTLTKTPGADYQDDGLNHLVAVIEDNTDGSGTTGPLSDVLIVRYDPAACTSDLDCDDGLFCTGVETCNVVGACEPGLAPAGDGVACTDDFCDEVLDTVLSTPNDANCDDALFCNGGETCDAVLDCQAGPDACGVGEICDEALDVCEAACAGDADCDGTLDPGDPCPNDPLNMCGGALTALCTAVGGNCGAIGEPIMYDVGPVAPTLACDGSNWLAETGANGSDYAGNVTMDGASVAAVFGCTDAPTEALAENEKYAATLTRSYPVANGQYSVSLLFSEAFQNNCDAGVGTRIMDVSIEGVEVLGDFDVFAAAQNENGVGCGSLVVRSFVASVVDGNLDVAIAADAASIDANANLKAIKVTEVFGCAVDADCDDGASCTSDTCTAGQCQYVTEPDGTSCDDGDLCTSADVCTAGVCGGVDDSDGDGLVDASDVSCGASDPCPADALNACVGTVAVDGFTGQAIRVNAGPTCSVAFTDCRGESWFADFGAQTALETSVCTLDGGTCALDATPVFGCSDAATEEMFRCEHYDGAVATPELVYDFDVADGPYLVNLFFMNSFTGTVAPGSRLFDVVIEGVTVLDEFDQVAEAGGNGPLVRSFPVDVTDGNGLQISLLHGAVENPAIKGIEVLTAPEPGQLALWLAGSGVLTALARRRSRRAGRG